MEKIKENTGGRAAEIYGRFTQRYSKDDEFADWEGYRAQLTDFVVRNMRPGASLLILGAGKCSDLDLNILAEHCGSVTLSDYRPETAEEALRQYGLSRSDRLRIAESDYVGITDEDYIRYTAQLIGIMEKLRDCPGDSLEAIAGDELKELHEELDRIYRDNEAYRIRLGGDYDYAIAAGLHSQLNNSFRGIFQYVRKDTEEKGGKVQFAEELNASIFENTRKHTLYLVQRLNREAFSAVREGIVYGYEKRIIYVPEGKQDPVIGTVDGARQAGEEVEELTAADKMNCLWPLSKRRSIKFEMDIRFLERAALDTYLHIHSQKAE
ncbi:MAG: hypothetical protein IKS63_03550 [Firmicutes bacterium]|nr:hypothetical protein [Bacillota bacterium]